MSIRQLPLDLGYRAAFGREDFLVAPCNSDAIRMIDSCENWPGRTLLLIGAAGAGKTHLTHVWRKMTGAVLVDGVDLDEVKFESLIACDRSIAIDNAEQVRESRILFHLYNFCRENRRYLLMTARQAPARWKIELRDLSSRLNASLVAELAPPDDSLIGAVLMKTFLDRQLQVPPEVLSYVLTRLERSFSALSEFVARADALSLANHKKITIPLARQVLAELEKENI